MSPCKFCWTAPLYFYHYKSWKLPIRYCCPCVRVTATLNTRLAVPLVGKQHYLKLSTKACFTFFSNNNDCKNSNDSNIKLDTLPFHTYLDDRGFLTFQDNWGKVSVYAIYDAHYRLQYIGISRDTRTSLLLHLIRMPNFCYYFKFHAFKKPSRTLLNQLREAWIKEMSEEPPIGNVDSFWQERWEGPINIRSHGWLTTEERHLLEQTDENNMSKILKQICRRVQKEIEKQLAERNVQEPVRFDPKLKEKGLLDGQSKKVDVPDAI